MCSRPEFKLGCIIQAMIGHQLHLNICLELPDKVAVAEHIFNQDHNIQLYNTKSSLSHLTTWISSSGGNWDEAPSQNGKGGWPNCTWLMTSHLHPYRTQNPQHDGWYAHIPFQDQKICPFPSSYSFFFPLPWWLLYSASSLTFFLLPVFLLPPFPGGSFIVPSSPEHDFTGPFQHRTTRFSATICSCQTFTAHAVPAYSSIHTHTHTHSQYSSCTAWPWR